MNLQEFSALKIGDKIQNLSLGGGTGEVVETTDSGVRVVWGEVTPNATRFFFSVVGTSWMHWNKVDDGGPGAMREMPYGA